MELSPIAPAEILPKDKTTDQQDTNPEEEEKEDGSSSTTAEIVSIASIDLPLPLVERRKHHRNNERNEGGNETDGEQTEFDVDEQAQLVGRAKKATTIKRSSTENNSGTGNAELFEPPFTAPLAPFTAPLAPFKKTSTHRRSTQNLKRLSDVGQHLLTAAQRQSSSSLDFLQHERDAEEGAGDGCGEQSLKSNESQKLYGSRLTGSTAVWLNSRKHHRPNKRPPHSVTKMTAPLEDGPPVEAERLGNDIPLAAITENCNSATENNISECPRSYHERPALNSSLMFDDGERSIDFVLAYKVQPYPQVEAENEEKRRVFEDNLESQGLELERTFKEKEQVHFVKIHAPLEVLQRYAEILKLRMPMAEIPGMAVVNQTSRSLLASLKCLFVFFLRFVYVDEHQFPRVTHRFTAIYSRDKEYLFDINHECFFTAAVRSRIVQFILDRQRFPAKNKGEIAFGIDRLVAESVYTASYPLHDGDITEAGTMRHKLYNHWASVRRWYRYQPLDYVKEYFGVKIGLYFAWLGFYTYMLLLASVVGLFCFIYSWRSLQSYEPVHDVCLAENSNHNVTMCPLCDWCNFWDLRETCFYAKITYLIDNPSTVFFAVFMSFWAALFLELWKRYSAEITHRWDLTGFDVHEEHPRPQYLAKLEHLPATRVDYVTHIKEPQVPFWRMKLPATVFSFSIVLLLIALAFVALLAVVVYRMSVLAALKVGFLKVGPNPMTTSSAIMLATASAAFINLCFLYVLNYLYNLLAEYLTELEMWRTQTQFDDSLTLKIYLLQFVNYYASIFYIAFFKGKFVGHPGQYNKIFDYRQEECSTGGCLTELCVQLAIIMIGKQAFNTILEVIFPLFWRKIQSIQMGLSRIFSHKQHENKPNVERWLRDLKLLDWGPRSLFPEYLEMVLQYGFVTIFVAAFPLAPFFALLNNILEMRLDAKKLITHHKRPVSQRVRDIGVWYRILDCIGKLSVITNGFIIAFTSDFIPRLVYRAIVSEDNTLTGYLNFTMSVFNVSDSDTLRALAAANPAEITTCRYTDFREPPSLGGHYYLTKMFYIILACRLGFVVIFENFVALVMILVRWCIPDMTVELRDQIRREVYITNELIIDMEAKRSREERAKRASSTRLSRTNSMNSLTDANDKFIKLERFLTDNLTQSQMDCILHQQNETGIAGDC